jgi:hypothetical protein
MVPNQEYLILDHLMRYYFSHFSSFFHFSCGTSSFELPNWQVKVPSLYIDARAPHFIANYFEIVIPKYAVGTTSSASTIYGYPDP